ncbi:MAG: stress response translation initiation inhibitor YciH [Anaerolineae bacterium]|nr:stress response translation initiation inhibitor YciH [Anaerolineae bacterium]MCO5192510.1 stress response translation initiation inhibitor YciH [Anaerolineae bacterium]MCO5200021.1 stress response translation initiation inhibitor YciH [Anaerolineae bacterium]
MRRRNAKIVYSTESGRIKQQPPPRKKSLPPEKQMAELMRERKGRGGKTVTVIAGLQLSDDDLKALAKQLKQQCGSGGAVKEGNIEIQGDHREKIAAELQKMGMKTKFVGG